jgi:hypothetical protein
MRLVISTASVLSALGSLRHQSRIFVGSRHLQRRREREADPDLAVRHFSRRAGVLSLHTDRVGSLLEKAGVVDDPRLDNLLLLELLQRVTRRFQPHAAIVPGRLQKVQHPLMRCIHPRRIGTDGLDALALGRAQRPRHVERE